MAKPKVIVHGYVPQEAIDAAMKLAEEMDKIEVLKRLQKGESILASLKV